MTDVGHQNLVQYNRVELLISFRLSEYHTEQMTTMWDSFAKTEMIPNQKKEKKEQRRNLII